MGIVTEYLKYQEEYEKKYGKRTVVLYQVGTFFEIYEYDPDQDESTTDRPVWPSEKLGHATYISTLLPYKLTRRNGNKPYSIHNPSMIGFPMVAYEQHKDKILAREYTIVLVEQERAGKDAPRKVTKVLSPATEINSIDCISNQIISIYIEVQKEEPRFEEYLITVGISSIDVTTGNSMVGEIYSKQKDQIYAIQEIYRYLLAVQPRELIVNINRVKNVGYKDYIIKVLELDKYPIYTVIVNETNKEYLEVHYQQQFLDKIFHPSISSGKIRLNIIKKTDIIEELNLERLYYGTISYVLLLQYCYEHDERLLEKIRKPDTHWIDEEKHLIITDNALKQLDILPSNSSNNNRGKKGITSLLDVVNNTSTPLGRRYLQTMLCNPITNTTILNEWYDMIHDMISSDLLKEIETSLKLIPDIERYQRKLQLKMIKPNEFSKLFRAYIEIVKLYTLILQSNTTLSKLLFTQVNDFNTCLTSILSKYNLDNLALSNIDNNKLVSDVPIFYEGRDATADQYHDTIKDYNEKINLIVTHLNSHLTKTRGKLIEYKFDSDKSGALGFITTAHKGKVLQDSNIDMDICGKIYLVNINKDVMVTSDIIGSMCQKSSQIKEQYQSYLYERFMNTLNEINKFDFFNDINVFVGKLDYVKSNAKTAIKNKYYKPEIIGGDGSYLDIKDLRHPVAEQLIDGAYVTNDITLGTNCYGILLYGSNAAGKSTLAKAVGLNIIMAQAGMYTSCHLKYNPYTKIITRLSGEDNLIQGKSSFVVEMSELRTIHRNADNRSLVLGDELCRGTETQSGSAIAVKAIKELVGRKSSFIFATHMHHIATDQDITLLGDKLRICHLVIKYDQDTKSLVFDRKIQEGPGESIYGLEVAMSLSFDPEFIKDALEIRSRMINKSQILSTKQSRYNKKVYMDSCAICGTQPNLVKGIQLESHHIEEQAKADKNGYIDNYHKDIVDNLIVLCESCHKNLHSNGVKILTQQTPGGKIIKLPL